VETARARGSSYYWEICRTARRRGVAPEYVVDRAVVLLTTIAERRKSDLYRILGVSPLASMDTIRQRWLEVAKQHHPDVGGDSARFRHAKQAYEVLRDQQRRAEYERFWVRAHGPFERVIPADDAVIDGAYGSPRPDGATEPSDVNDGGEAFPPDSLRATLDAASRLFAARAALDRQVGAVGDVPGIAGLLSGLEAALAPIRHEDLDRLSAEVAEVTARLEAVRDHLATLAALRGRIVPQAA
jgi:hypothetical protein